MKRLPRKAAYSKLATLEAARLLQAMGGEVKVFDPTGIPLPDGAPDTHPKVQELRSLAAWSEGKVWCSPERHGARTGIMKAQIDWIPLNTEAVRPTQGKTLAVMQVSGGSQSFNAVNQMRILGRWMRMVTIPNQSSVAKAFNEFDEAGRMKASAYYDRIVDVMEELFKFTLLTRGVSPYLVDRYSERKQSAVELSKRVKQQSSNLPDLRQYVEVSPSSSAAGFKQPQMSDLYPSDRQEVKMGVNAQMDKGWSRSANQGFLWRAARATAASCSASGRSTPGRGKQATRLQDVTRSAVLSTLRSLRPLLGRSLQNVLGIPSRR